jgi:hypothetical protein
VQSLDPPEIADKTDEFEPAVGPAVSCPGDLWLLGQHRLFCGSALEASAYDALVESERVAAIALITRTIALQASVISAIEIRLPSSAAFLSS